MSESSVSGSSSAPPQQQGSSHIASVANMLPAPSDYYPLMPAPLPLTMSYEKVAKFAHGVLPTNTTNIHDERIASESRKRAREDADAKRLLEKFASEVETDNAVGAIRLKAQKFVKSATLKPDGITQRADEAESYSPMTGIAIARFMAPATTQSPYLSANRQTGSYVESKPKSRSDKRQIDIFLDEIKSGHFGPPPRSSERQALDASADHLSTNIFVSGLPQDVSEERLVRHFGAFGAIASVKIMRPRRDEEVHLTRTIQCELLCLQQPSINSLRCSLTLSNV